jgi:alpha-L-arabinofuranosidase
VTAGFTKTIIAMKRTLTSLIASLAILGLSPLPAPAAPSSLTAVVQADQPGHPIPKTLYGIFFEDINYAADGGIYAELIANRGFDWPTPDLQAWVKDYRGDGIARVTRQSAFPLHPNTAQYLRIEVIHPGKNAAGVGVANGGFGGIALKQGATYDLAFYARPHRNYRGGLTVALESKSGQRLAAFRLDPQDWKNTQPTQKDRSPLDPDALANWVKYTAELQPSTTVADARLVVLCDAAGTVDIEFVSLFPRDTYQQRRHGLRADLVELLKELRPGSMRFPGGCIVEGTDLANLYDWKRTVGPVERRPVNANLWGYWQSGGLGFFEYFQLAEDIGAEPLPILAAGMSCQFRKFEMIPLDALDGVIQGALDLIEFANGAPDTPWGGVRAAMGHAEPFHLKLLGIGNENWSMEFINRYEILYKGIKARHPEIQIVSSAGAGPAGAEYDLAWDKIPKIGADWIDEHYYVSADWLFQSNARYDRFDRQGPRVYVGEYACHLPNKANSLFAALAEASMMTGFERNSDIVGMTAYAPLFNKIGNTQWTPDLIWFDNTRSFGTPSYHVQKLFMRNRPDVHLPLTARAVEPPTLPPAGRIGLQTWNSAAEYRDLRVTRGGQEIYAWDPARGLEGWSEAREGKWESADGVLRQSATDVSQTMISTGDPAWRDYTVRLKARKLGGAEGFIIRVRDQGSRFVHVNLGGWGNTQHGIEQNGANPITRKPGKIESNRWYDIEIALEGERVSVKLDGATLFDRVAVPAAKAPPVTLVSGYDQQAREIVVKCVNPTPEPCTLQLTLAGATVPAQQAERITLTGSADDINDLDHPHCVAPVEDTLPVRGPECQSTLRPMSLTILRIQATLK